MILEEMMAEEIEDIKSDIERLKGIKADDCLTATIRRAVEVLERQKPKRVDIFGELKCPACGKYLTAVKCLSDVNYCFYCGQRVYVDVDLPEGDK